MLSSCTIGPGIETTDEHFATVSTFDGPPVYVGKKCKVRFVSSAVSDVITAGQIAAVQIAVLSLPIEGSAGVRSGMRVRIDTNPEDPALEGQMFKISGMHGQSFATARRFLIEAVS
jgi:hypothetical protein